MSDLQALTSQLLPTSVMHGSVTPLTSADYPSGGKIRRSGPSLASATRTSPDGTAQHDLAEGSAVRNRPQRPAGIGERIRLDGGIGQRPGLPQLQQVPPQLGHQSRVPLEELARGDPQHAGVTQQEP